MTIPNIISKSNVFTNPIATEYQAIAADVILNYNMLAFPNTILNDYRNFPANKDYFATILSNLAYYGYCPSSEAYKILQKMSAVDLQYFWSYYEPLLKNITGANRNMEKFVVYKNFPAEVLSKSEAEYWINQILMYIGLPNELFTEEKINKPKLNDKLKLKVLHLAAPKYHLNIINDLISSASSWTQQHAYDAKQLLNLMDVQSHLNKTLTLSDFKFKENGINLIIYVIKNKLNINCVITTATDVLRLAAGLSDGDISLRKSVKFKKFKRSIRKQLVTLLDDCKHLQNDLSERKEEWKRFLSILHPGDFPNKNVSKAYSMLYTNKLKSFGSIIENANYSNTQSLTNVLATLVSRPGEFLRRFHGIYKKYSKKSINNKLFFDNFIGIFEKLNTVQLLKFYAYLKTYKNRKTFIVAPKGNWANAKILDNTKVNIAEQYFLLLTSTIEKLISDRLTTHFPNGVAIDENISKIKIPVNGQELGTYGRGTRFPIPDNIKFIRSASFWQHKINGLNCWFDNGWNFFDNNWSELGSCCWTVPTYKNAAIFSGDPTNSKDLEGKACQMIDLYLDKLEKAGVAYAVWSVLSYNHILFSDASDILATMQWGENAETGKLFEPSRITMSFPLHGNYKSKYIAYIDIKNREIVFMDVSFGMSVHSATSNGEKLQEYMPAYIEYLNSLPSLADLFQNNNNSNSDIKILYSDENVTINDKSAYVFKPSNKNNTYTPISIEKLLK